MKELSEFCSKNKIWLVAFKNTMHKFCLYQL